MSAFRGDIGGLLEWAREMENLATSSEELTGSLSAESLRLVLLDHLDGAGPYGPWAPNKPWKRRISSAPPLTLTEEMRGRWRMFFGPASFGLDNDSAYVAVHQRGTSDGRIPARPMVPDDDHGGDFGSWAPHYNRVARAWLARHIRGAEGTEAE